MNFEPHDYQLRGGALLCNQSAGLLLDPGLGKTSTVLMAFAMLKEQYPKWKMLVVAPIKPMYGTWAQEGQKWDQFQHLTVTVLHGPHKDELIKEDTDIHVVNPEGLVWLFKNKDLPEYDVLCIDESTKFKNSKSMRFKMLKPFLPEFKLRWILTGTVIPNGLMDLFGQVYIMDLGAGLGSNVYQYRNTYFYQSGYGGYTYLPREGALEVISERIEDNVLCLSAEDYLDMPDLMKFERMCELSATVRELYDRLEKEFIVELEGGTLLAANAAVAGTKLRQIANGQVYLESDMGDRTTNWLHDEKIRELLCLVEETNGHPLLIFYEFQHDRDRIVDELGRDAVCITGLTGIKLNQVLLDFNHGKIRFLLAHPGSVHGLNVQGSCFHMIWYGLPWNLEHYTQAVWRLYRQGQTSDKVYCYHILGTGTLDERVSKVLLAKEATQDKLEEALKRAS